MNALVIGHWSNLEYFDSASGNIPYFSVS
uniref:Uncharacterized protein n=1 Tax=Arundo donax TaxID=35708 RepID=A0A0A8ZAJ8_ARUDO